MSGGGLAEPIHRPIYVTVCQQYKAYIQYTTCILWGAIPVDFVHVYPVGAILILRRRYFCSINDPGSP